uniref:Secreted protein n=1 Tax=Macrostomum lignano TaxID=282301 RepID=A0A1I8FG01_9PLAT
AAAALLNGRGAWLISLCLLLVGTTACVACLCGLRRRAAAGSSAPRPAGSDGAVQRPETEAEPMGLLDGEDRNGDAIAHLEPEWQLDSLRLADSKTSFQGGNECSNPMAAVGRVELNCLKLRCWRITAEMYVELSFPTGKQLRKQLHQMQHHCQAVARHLPSPIRLESKLTLVVLFAYFS